MRALAKLGHAELDVRVAHSRNRKPEIAEAIDAAAAIA
jgi:hypothetical protein